MWNLRFERSIVEHMRPPRRCLTHSEPALLVGETGIGKTTLCQMLALMRGQRLHIINCNRNTEASEILGGYRPARRRQAALDAVGKALKDAARCASMRTIAVQARRVCAGQRRHTAPQCCGCTGCADLLTSCVACSSPVFEASKTVPPAPPALLDTHTVTAAVSEFAAATHAAVRLCRAADGSDGENAKPNHEASPVPQAAVQALLAAVTAAEEAAAAARAPFVWADGPLVVAMKQGDVILIDEINLADDAVLERLNSVLEPARTLMLAEKGGSDAEVIVAHEAFRVVATMNPGGDHGKRELSPALSNRFTQVSAAPTIRFVAGLLHVCMLVCVSP